MSDRLYRSTVFGEDAEHYDAVRPSYLDTTIDQVLAYADLGALPALEVGAGTGKATVPFAARGVPILCVEPDPRMAAVLRRNTAAYPAVTVEISRFEAWNPAGRRFGLMYASASWNWIDPEAGWTLVHESLVPGGAVAILGNPIRATDVPLLTGLAAIDEEYGVAAGNHVADLAFARDPQPPADSSWPITQIADDPRFTGIRSLHIAQPRRLSTAEYVAFLATISAYRITPEPARTNALSAIAKLLDSRGGGIDITQLNGAVLARTAT